MLKRAFDITMATIGVLIMSPLLLLIGLAIRLESPGPVFYRGARVGRGGKLFRIFKFRTMVSDAEKLGGSSTPEDDPRITRLGGLLRRYKMDELPQLLNVIRGEMSLVGPRPQVQWAVDRYSEEEREILRVRPGITDPASLRFPNEGEILRGSADPDADYWRLIHPEKMRLSGEYVRNASLFEDIRIILRTFRAILR